VLAPAATEAACCLGSGLGLGLGLGLG